jgi:hypothetical protein
MGESKNGPLRLDFDRQLKLEFHGSTVTSDAGLLAYRELDDALALTCNAATGLHDARTGQNTQHSLTTLLRQSIYSRLAGYEDVNDAQRLCLDPAMRAIVGGSAKVNTAASTSEMARFETETLSRTDNLKHLIDRSGKWIDQAHHHRKLTNVKPCRCEALRRARSGLEWSSATGRRRPWCRSPSWSRPRPCRIRLRRCRQKRP